MPVYHLQNVLSGGEISPLMRGRVDQPRYQTGCRLMQNMVPMPQGGATRRPGTRFRGKALSAKSWFIPFVFSATQGRVLEFGGGKLRIWLPDGSAVTTQFDIPYADADLTALRYAQSADVVFFAHPGYAPRKLSRHADNDWRWTQITFVPDIAAPTGLAAAIVERTSRSTTATRDYYYVVTAIDADTGQESSASTAVSITAKSLDSIDYIIRLTWTAVPKAKYYRVYKRKYGIYGYIGRADSACTFDDENIGADTADNPPEYDNPFTAAGEYPSQVFFLQQRLIWASSGTKPITFWFSRSGEYESLAQSTTPKDDDAITTTPAGNQANKILWVQPDRQNLVFGTEGSEWTLSASEGVAITPSSQAYQPQSRVGGHNSVPAIVVGGAVLFLQRGGHAVQQLAYNYSADKYLPQDLNILSRHMLADTEVVSWAYQQEPYSVLWCVLADGTLKGLTYMPEQEVIGWHRHTTAGQVKCVVTIPGTPDDQVWLLVQRDSDLCIETLETFFDGSDLTDACFLDCALKYEGAPATTLTGFTHLAGKAVQVFADGGTIDGLAVTADGSLTLPRAASSALVGLPATAKITVNLPEVSGQTGSTILKSRKVTGVRLRIYRSMSFKYGFGVNLFTAVDRKVTDGTFSASPFYTEGTDIHVETCSGWQDTTPLTIAADTPTPLTILAILTAIDVAPFSGAGG